LSAARTPVSGFPDQHKLALDELKRDEEPTVDLLDVFGKTNKTTKLKLAASDLLVLVHSTRLDKMGITSGDIQRLLGTAMADLQRFDLISLFDIDFKKSNLQTSDLARITNSEMAGTRKLLEYFSSSYSWVFQVKTKDQNALPGMVRSGLTEFAKKSGLRDACLLISPQLGVGVLCMQHETGGVTTISEAIKCKRENNGKAWAVAKQFSEDIEKVGLPINEIERSYPVVGVQVRDKILDSLLGIPDEQLQIARVFTGDYEHERDDSLIAYVQSNDLSRRSFERLYIRWTDALAVYDHRVGDDYKTALFRCVLIYETCVLMRRMLRSTVERMDRLYLAMGVIPRPFSVERLTSAFAHIRGEFIMSPPVQSVEAQRLLASAYEKFGIYQIAEATGERARMLENRYQWAKALALGTIAVLTYLLDKFSFFEWIKGKITHIP
jgi:hypothetical protein